MLESMSRRKYTPIGVFEYAQNFGKKTIGDHIDFLADIGGTIYGGKWVKANRMYISVYV